MTVTGFHEGEVATQRLAGVEANAKRLERMLDTASLSVGAAKFLAAQRFVAFTARDADDVLWTSPIAGPPGFLQGHDDQLRILAAPRSGDPLHELAVGQQVGLIAIDFEGRRRMRLNGVLRAGDKAGLVVGVDQAYGNCPQYIHRHAIDVPALSTSPQDVTRAPSLDASALKMISAAGTFFLGTTHPTRGSDASHRGGPPGFVRVESPNRLWWPDYPGNNMFNSFGNLAVNDEAALLFVDFETGASLQLTGTAQVQWTSPGEPGDDGGVGRRVAFTVESVVTRVAVARSVGVLDNPAPGHS